MSTGFIFDVDGTILDSMGIWMNVGELYLKDMGIKAEPNLGEILFEMTMNEGAEYIQKKYNLNLTTEEICTGINNRVYKFYEKEAMPKPKVIDFIEQAYDNKIPMTIATSTDRPMIEAAFKRLHIDKYFKKIFTTTEVGYGKDKPDIFIKAMEEMGTSAASDVYKRQSILNRNSQTTRHKNNRNLRSCKRKRPGKNKKPNKHLHKKLDRTQNPT